MNKNRASLLLIAVLVAAAVVGVVIAFVGKGSGSGTPAATQTAQQTTGNQESALKGVPQHGLMLGKATAPATLYVFEDPQCPYCRQWSLDSVPATVNQFVKTGLVNLVLQPIEIIGDDSVPGLRAVFAAANQNKAWNMLEALYQRQGEEQSGWITNAVIADAAAAAGANASTIKGAMNSKPVTNAWRTAELKAQKWGINGTPTFVLVKDLGVPQQLNEASLEPADFTSALRAALQ